jgi:hypothetical protein
LPLQQRIEIFQSQVFPADMFEFHDSSVRVSSSMKSRRTLAMRRIDLTR